MRVIVQRCSQAEVRIDNAIVGKIGKGFVLLVGITDTDTQADADVLAKKIAQLRVFEDNDGKLNLSLGDVNGALLSISQFTLYADCRKGNRPSFIRAARPEIAEPVYDYFNEVLRNQYSLKVETGHFGADMKVDFINDGPVTILLDSSELGISNNPPKKEAAPELQKPKNQIILDTKSVNKADARVLKLVRVLGKQVLPRRQIMAELGLHQQSRFCFINNYLRPACEQGYVIFAYPNSPNKPEQAYCLTENGLALYSKMTK